MQSHMPVNHPLRPLYRGLAALAGLYVLVFGIVGVAKTGGYGFFQQHGTPSALGLHSNRAFAILSIVAGAIIVGSAVYGRNLDRWVNLFGGIVFLVSGFAMMVLLRTGLNFLGFTMTTCIVSFVIGLILLTAGFYGRVASSETEAFEDRFRHGGPPVLKPASPHAV
jgi:membrane-associated HD superfamily phosphohydrolase